MEQRVEGQLLYYASTRIEILDRDRRAEALARVGKTARGKAGADAGDRALAAVVRACGLDRYLYRGVFGRAARGRLARLEDYAQVTGATRAAGAAVEAVDTRFANGVGQALSDGIDGLTSQLSAEIHHRERLEASQHSTHHPHHHDSGSSQSAHHSHHSSGSSYDSGTSDSGGGHHHH
ncbi:GPP34 family phosphoprotein [Catenulispora pinistramenti]|uniref:GPP34 family phosphoprotein n=1 Tax=Catenulispora pinistramenti TaxID=2705254 RepID=UPI001E389D1C|nr:GPP34 family phosphoprotein [Catenulispora pinistramenti]